MMRMTKEDANLFANNFFKTARVYKILDAKFSKKKADLLEEILVQFAFDV